MVCKTPRFALRVAVLVSAGRNPISGTPRANRNDVVALQLAKSLPDSEVHVIHAGDANDPALPDYLAFGADCIETVPVAAGVDIVPALAHHLSGFDLVLTGQRAEASDDTGLLPYALASRLEAGVVSGALDLSFCDECVQVTQFLPKGKRRKLAVSLPAVIAIHPLAPAVTRYAFAGKKTGSIISHKQEIAALAEAPVWQLAPAGKKPPQLKAKQNQSGHARMLSAIVTEGAGGVVISEGSADEKAQALMSYLRENQIL